MRNAAFERGFVKRIEDRNAVAQEGMEVVGRFVQRLPRAMIVSFRVAQTQCRGILPISQFPASTWSMRDKMFAIARVGHETFKFKVIKVLRPDRTREFTVVILTAREDFDPLIYQQSKEA